MSKKTEELTPWDYIRDLPDIEHKIEWYAVMVNDELAARLLSFNREPVPGKESTNRKASPASVERYRDAMLADEWYLSTQSIAFSVDNELIDGQQRLKALREANKIKPGIAIPLMIAINAPGEVKYVLDQGKTRLSSDFLRMAGEANGQPLSYGLRLLYVYKEVPYSPDAWRKTRLTPTTQRAFLDKNKALRQGVLIARQMPTAVKLTSVPTVSVFWTIVDQEYPDAYLGTEFLQAFNDGTNDGNYQAAWNLREYLANKQFTGAKLTGPPVLGLLINAFNIWRMDQGSKFMHIGNAYNRIVKQGKFPRLMTAVDKEKGQLPGL